MVDEHGYRLEERRMRVALGQEPQQARERRKPVERQRRADEPRRAQVGALDLKAAEMLVEPRPPGHLNAVARLQHRLLPLRAPAVNEAEMPPVGRASSARG